MQKINTNLQNYRNKYDEITMQFESVKAKRYKSFSDCLERVTAEIDHIYKVSIYNYVSKFCLLCSLFFRTLQFLFDLSFYAEIG